MNFRGRQIDPLSFWSKYVTFPSGTKPDETFTPKAQCPNPAHDTLKSHFQVNLSEPKVHCFAYCGISGSYEHAVCMIEGLYDKYEVDVKVIGAIFDKHPGSRTVDDREQLRRWKLAQRKAYKLIIKGSTASKFHGRPVARKKSQPVLQPDVDLSYERYLPQAPLEYLTARGITDSSIAKWELGWDSEALRMVIPARDENGRLRFLIKRATKSSQNPKYLYTEGYPKTSLLFGACYIDLGLVHSESLILCEGSLDVVSFHQDGFPNATGILGTGISDQQVRIIEKLRPKKIIFAFDKDAAGVKNIEIAARKLRKYPLYVMRYPKDRSDPAELSRKEKQIQISRAVPYPMFQLKARTNPRKKGITVG